jgi:hypothetical protein
VLPEMRSGDHVVIRPETREEFVAAVEAHGGPEAFGPVYSVGVSTPRGTTPRISVMHPVHEPAIGASSPTGEWFTEWRGDRWCDMRGVDPDKPREVVEALLDCTIHPMDSVENLKARVRARRLLQDMGVPLP